MMRILQFVWACLMTICLFSLASSVIFAIWVMYAGPLKAAERSDLTLTKANRCFISKDIFDLQMQETGHPELLQFPPDLARRFVIGWNATIQGHREPVTTDGVVLYDNPQAPSYRIAFLKGNCLVDTIDVGEDGFWAVVKASDDTRWKI